LALRALGIGEVWRDWREVGGWWLVVVRWSHDLGDLLNFCLFGFPALYILPSTPGYGHFCLQSDTMVLLHMCTIYTGSLTHFSILVRHGNKSGREISGEHEKRATSLVASANPDQPWQ
jgi:hypothetical protein